MMRWLLLISTFSSCVFAHRQSVGTSQACSHPSLSCPDSLPSPLDSCCLNHPSGHFLLTQFWDTKPALGKPDEWTIHGLWPDLCSGGFDQFCDQRREYSNISAILEDASSCTDLVQYLKSKWLSINGDNNHLWAHEWNKHGTCISTLNGDCYSSESEKFDAVRDYFNHAARLYSTLNTYQILSENGINPSSHRTYTIHELRAALATSHGGETVTFRCRGNELDEVWYHFHVRGSLRHATPFNSSLSIVDATNMARHHFIPVAPDGAKTNCPRTGIKYLPKDDPSHQPTHTSSPGTSTSTSPTSTPTTPFTGKGHLVVRVIGPTDPNSSPSSSSSYTGCLIRGGKWYSTSGSSCATYIAKSDPNHLSTHQINADANLPQSPLKPKDDKDEHFFTLSSLYSPCAIVTQSNLFTCAKDLGVQSIFHYKNVSSSSTNESGKKAVLAVEDSVRFWARKVPEKFEKVDVFVERGDDEKLEEGGEGGGIGRDEMREAGGGEGVEVQIEWAGL